MPSTDPTLPSPAPPTHALTGRRLRVVKGCRRVWSGNVGRAVEFRAGEKWTVVAVDPCEGGATVTLTRNGARVRLGTAQAAKLARARFNLNTGDPLVFVTFDVIPT